MKDKVVQITEYIMDAQKDVDIKVDRETLIRRLTDIDNIDQVKQLNQNNEDPLYQWVPSIVYTLFGFDSYLEFSNKTYKTTYLIINPLYKDNFDFVEPIINSNRYEIELYTYRFSRRLAANIYGGFPWYQSYYRICEEYNIFGNISITIKITKVDGTDCINELIDFKDNFRKLHPEFILRKDFPNLDFDGIINPFHTPNKIENQQHINAIEKEILDKYVIRWHSSDLSS